MSLFQKLRWLPPKKPRLCSVCNKSIEKDKTCSSCRGAKSRKRQRQDSGQVLEGQAETPSAEEDEETMAFTEASPQQPVSPFQLQGEQVYLNSFVASLIEGHKEELDKRDQIITKKDKTIQELQQKLKDAQK
jgi:pyruvate/2-oxoacid:ferredoxin oxidoreductase alpha subunit